MRMFPPCSEVFRRLSIVLAIPILVILMGMDVAAMVDATCAHAKIGCSEDGPSCQAFKQSVIQRCLAEPPLSLGKRFEIYVWPFLTAIIVGYVVAMFIRSIGWVALGVTRRPTRQT